METSKVIEALNRRQKGGTEGHSGKPLEIDPIKLLQEVVDHDWFFHGSLEECLESLRSAIGIIDAYNALNPHQDKDNEEYSRLFKAIESALRSEREKKIVYRLDEVVGSRLCLTGDVYLLAGLIAGLRFGGASPEKIGSEVSFMRDRLGGPAGQERGGRQ